MDRVDPRVDYDAIEGAVAEAGRAHPHATKLVPLLSGGEPIVEVWTGDRARIYIPEVSR